MTLHKYIIIWSDCTELTAPDLCLRDWSDQYLHFFDSAMNQATGGSRLHKPMCLAWGHQGYCIWAVPTWRKACILVYGKPSLIPWTPVTKSSLWHQILTLCWLTFILSHRYCCDSENIYILCVAREITIELLYHRPLHRTSRRRRRSSRGMMEFLRQHTWNRRCSRGSPQNRSRRRCHGHKNVAFSR